jgi:ubiquinone/menaquinone biosynthesis C-methylase UbiE
MVKLYLNPNVVFKSKQTFSCIYNLATGWYYKCNKDYWDSLRSYKDGKEVEISKLPPSLKELLNNKFLIGERKAKKEDYLDFYPIRIPETVYYVNGQEIDVAVEQKGGHGEIDFEIKTLKGVDAKFWLSSRGFKTLRQIDTELHIKKTRLFKLIRDWVSIENQILRMLTTPVTNIKIPPPQLIYKAPFLSQNTQAPNSEENVRKYHLETIKDGREQFDRIESTVSHLYRVSHPILDDRSYGKALYSKLNTEKEIESGMRILEIGGGMGTISKDILKELKKDGKKVKYCIYDLSPALIRSQKELHKTEAVKSYHINGNGEILALKDSTIDVALSNEVIADFYTPEVPTKEVKEFLFDHEIPMSEEFFYPYREAPEKVRVNLGAFMLMKELYRVLKPGGLAVITEFGYQDRLPFRAGHLDHAEYSIQFAQLISVSTALGFNLFLTDVYDFLGFRDDVKLMSGYSYQAAYRLLEHHNINLPNITYTEDLFKKQLGENAENFRGLIYVQSSKDPFKIVKVMVCKKPE